MPGLRALGLQDRAEALLHLYQMTVPDHPVMLLPKQAALFVVSGPSHTLTPQRFVVWEHVHEDNASYIFHWKGEQTFLDIQTLSQTPGWRKSLLSDLGNKKRLGYHKRVVHRADGDGDPMRAWKSKIDSALRS